jgi:ferredoxin
MGGVQGCTYGCLGFGDCADACPYDAISMQDGLPVIDYEKCTGCGECVRTCPRHLYERIPFIHDSMLVVACSNRDPGREVRKVCEVGCIGCKACTKALDVFLVEDNLARIDYSKYQEVEDFKPAVAKCPRRGMVIFGKPEPQNAKELADQEEIVPATM